MKIVYVAGPFRGPTAWDIAENIRAAERIGRLVALAGAMPLIPHANTAHFEGQRSGQFWLDGTMELMRRCDGVVFLPSWRASQGSLGEFREAGRLCIPRLCLDNYTPDVFPFEIAGFVQWITDGKEQERQGCRDSVEATGNGTPITERFPPT